jgi:hypothetical protein
VNDPDTDRDRPRRLHCGHCHDVIGAYEPMILENHQGVRQTSLAAEPSLYETDHACFHLACYREARDHAG